MQRVMSQTLVDAGLLPSPESLVIPSDPLPVVAAGADHFTASQLKRRRDRLERRLAHLQARTAGRDPRTVQYDTAEASALQTALSLFDDAIQARAPARRWLKDQVRSIDPDLPVAEMTDEQLRGVVGVHMLRLRSQLDKAEAAPDRRTAEVEASNHRHGELVAERAALRRERDQALAASRRHADALQVELGRAEPQAPDLRADGEPDPEPPILASMEAAAQQYVSPNRSASLLSQGAVALRQALAVAARFKRLAREGSNLPEPRLGV